ncbi:hypothetical protein [Microbacterium sp. zg-YB36]|uniref:hypothetical protein n=1 Tax=Microbacterium sp. zg-YB36 TaxID=2969407 RepID=UPI00214CA54A|nr:hypothetical protein [Microbacterium sp. zg-YB36]MDL5351083.1 hypothetical protein [Microbacterium sp. zg-YB36]
MRRTLPSLLGLLAVAAVLAGCTNQPAPQRSDTASSNTPSPATSPPVTPTPAPTPTPATAEVTTLPDCANLLTLDQVRNTAQMPNAEAFGDLEEFDGSHLPGPVARQTFASASATVACSYGVPQTDSGAYVSVALIAPGASESLVDALSSAAVYTATTRGGIPVFSMSIEDELGSTIAYAFDANVWAIADGTALSHETAANLALAAVTRVVEGSS